jgi:hypothetical protein
MLTIAGLTAADISAIAFPIAVSDSTDCRDIAGAAADATDGDRACAERPVASDKTITKSKLFHTLFLNTISPPDCRKSFAFVSAKYPAGVERKSSNYISTKNAGREKR